MGGLDKGVRRKLGNDKRKNHVEQRLRQRYGFKSRICERVRQEIEGRIGRKEYSIVDNMNGSRLVVVVVTRKKEIRCLIEEDGRLITVMPSNPTKPETK